MRLETGNLTSCFSSVVLDDDTRVNYLVTFSQPDFLASTRALPSSLYSLSEIQPLSSVNSRTTDRYFYLSHVTLPVVIVMGLATIFIMLCSVNNMWYNFIKDVVNVKQNK